MQIKPDGVNRGLVGCLALLNSEVVCREQHLQLDTSVIADVQVMEILQRFEQKGYKLVAAKVIHAG